MDSDYIIKIMLQLLEIFIRNEFQYTDIFDLKCILKSHHANLRKISI